MVGGQRGVLGPSPLPSVSNDGPIVRRPPSSLALSARPHVDSADTRSQSLGILRTPAPSNSNPLSESVVKTPPVGLVSEGRSHDWAAPGRTTTSRQGVHLRGRPAVQVVA